MSYERQTVHGWPVAIDLFLGGVGAGAFLVAFVLNLLNIQEEFARMMLFVGPALVSVGALFLLADITMRSRVYRLFSSATSWTSRGAWILTFFIVSGLNYALMSSHYLSIFSWLNVPALRLLMGALAAFLSVLVLIYPGILMGSLRAIPFWNTPVLPVLFLFSGLANGIAFFLLTLPFVPFLAYKGSELYALFGSILFIVALAQGAVLYAFLAMAARGDVASRESLRLLETSRFPLTMFSLGLFIPLGLIGAAMFIGTAFMISLLSITAAILFLAGGLYLRYAILRSGVFLPRFLI